VLLTVTCTHVPATDLGYLLRKHPDRAQEFSLSFGRAQVFYPEANEVRCTAALLVEVDPVGLVRNRRGSGSEGGLLDQYVNDRPYAASSFLSVALAQVFDSALGGRCKEKPELADLPLPLEAEVAVVPCHPGETFLHQLFKPLGYAVTVERLPLDPRFPEWGEGRYYRLHLAGTVRLHELLSHLYVLLPVLDNDKHYWVGDDEVTKLLRHGEGWLAGHPEREAITRRYLKHQRSLVSLALRQLDDGGTPDPEVAEAAAAAEEARVEKPLNLNEQRLGAVQEALRASGARTVLDLGCGEGRLTRLLFRDRAFTRVVGMDVSHQALEIAAKRLHWDQLNERERERVALWHGSLMYRDERLAGFDAAAVVEVIEHLDPPRLAAFERVVFECARPGTVVVTTPNQEYNVRWESLPAGQFRHRDHRFEWTRAEFSTWAERVAATHGYSVSYLPVGPVDAEVGAPTQMAVFTRTA
jgi:3' terminal RNA ribose 2'-O-methyltransferase Hen1